MVDYYFELLGGLLLGGGLPELGLSLVVLAELLELLGLLVEGWIGVVVNNVFSR
jgi:hypothetical protein